MLEKPILIAYATHTGTTREIAEVLDKLFREKGASVEVRDLEAIRDLSLYRAVVLGSSIRYNEWLPEAVDFVRQHQDQLRSKPLFYFSLSMTMQQDTPAHVQDSLEFLRPVRELAEPLDIGLFAGQLDPAELTQVAREIVQERGFPVGDWRDWAAIQAWGERVWSLLNQEEVAGGI
ncbi:MAG: flavodoxin domain-containing protein [Thermaceae bacterium]|nr:flavodoxin domain-containing protein [Thermaceae bacterium]